MITQLSNQPMQNNSILKYKIILKMNDDKRLQSECHIYVNCKGTLDTNNQPMENNSILKIEIKY